MRVATHVIPAVLIGVLWAGPAAAQTQATPQVPGPVSTSANYAGTISSHWLASGFVGANFGLDTDDGSFDYGGQLGYLWRGVFGAELLASYSPAFQVGNLILADDPTVLSLMANAIAAIPVGAGGNVQPYASGGLGTLQMHTSIFNVFIPGTNLIDGATDGERTSLAWNVGAGVMGFIGNVGFRGDIRYFRARTDNDLADIVPVDALTQTVLSGIEFWRANIGVALRW